MKRTDGPVSDALVDAYRDIMTIKRNLAVTGEASTALIRGAGVSPTSRIVPGKRLRNWHRGNRRGLSFRAFVRAVASRTIDGYGIDGARIALMWLQDKGARP